MTARTLTAARPHRRPATSAAGILDRIIAFDSLDEAFDAINASPYGLQSGIFTKSNEMTFKAIRRMRVGGIIINGTSTWRTDRSCA